MGLTNKYLNNTTKIEKQNFDNACFKGEAIVYDDDELLAAFRNLKSRITALKTAYGDVSKAYDKLLQSTTTGDDMNTSKGVGKGINNAKLKARARKTNCDTQISKLEIKINALEAQMAADQAREEKESEKTANENDADEKVEIN